MCHSERLTLPARYCSPCCWLGAKMRFRSHLPAPSREKEFGSTPMLVGSAGESLDCSLTKAARWFEAIRILSRSGAGACLPSEASSYCSNSI